MGSVGKLWRMLPVPRHILNFQPRDTVEMDKFDLGKLFHEWPTEMPRQGIVVTSQDEQIPFSGFLTHEGVLLLERKTPDAMGSRIVFIPYENIVGVKLTDVVSPKVFEKLGFAGTLKTK